MPKPAVRSRTDDVFFNGVAVLLIGYVVIGFWHSYIGAGLFAAHLPSILVHVHAVLFSGWIALFLAQNALIASGNDDRTVVQMRGIDGKTYLEQTYKLVPGGNTLEMATLDIATGHAYRETWRKE